MIFIAGGGSVVESVQERLIEEVLKIRDIFAPVGAALALALAIVELFQPPESRMTRLSPGILLVIAALMGARTALRRQAQKRQELLKAVPKRPLGLDDEN